MTSSQNPKTQNESQGSVINVIVLGEMIDYINDTLSGKDIVSSLQDCLSRLIV